MYYGLKPLLTSFCQNPMTLPEKVTEEAPKFFPDMDIVQVNLPVEGRDVLWLIGELFSTLVIALSLNQFYT